MARIFSVLAVLAVLLLGANFLVGLAGGDFNGAANHKREAQRRLISQPRTATTGSDRSKEEAALAIADAAFAGPRSWMTLHMLLGSGAALIALLVNSIAITYFIGTSRWCKEVCETYQLAPALAERSTRLKRGTFPWALAGIFSVIAVVGLGAAADPSGANWPRAASFVMPHYVAAMIALVVVAVAFWVQINRIAENYQVIEEIVAEVRAIRAARNLPAEEQAAL